MAFFLRARRAIFIALLLCMVNVVRASSSSDGARASGRHEIVEEKVMYSRWRSVIQRKVRTPDGKIIDYDPHPCAPNDVDRPVPQIQDQKGSGAVIIFAWDTKSKTATVVREYNPGCHRILGGLAAGIVETCPTKHGADPLLAARHELEEECHLAGGTWYRLTAEGVSVPMDKYVITEITAYLVVDPERVENPRPLDDEEDIEIVEGVTANEILDMIRGGDMNLVGGWASLLALQKLRELGEIIK